MKRITEIKANEAINIKKKIRVAAYCRVSTASDEQLISLEAQKAHYEKYIKANDEWEYAGLFFDEGITGTKKELRDGLASLIKACEDNEVDLIITKSISRFSRNTTDCLELVRKLLDLKVTVIFEKENINTSSMESELMLSILSSLAESESRSISENSKWSIQKRFKNGTFIISYPPYGYANVDGMMEIIPEQAEIVKAIFMDALSGKSTHAIAKALNEKGIPTKKSGKWTPGTINAMLRNEKYVGDVLYQKSYTDDNFNRFKNNGDFTQYLFENHHEPIISRDVFERVNALIDHRGKEKGNGHDTDRYNQRYAFSSKIICGECGGVFKRRHNYKPSGEYISWCCGKHIEDKSGCSMKYVRDENIKATYLAVLNKLIFAKDIVLKPLLRNLQGYDDKNRLLKIQEYDDLLEKNMEQRQVLTSLMASGILEPAVFNSESQALTLEEERLQRERSGVMNSVTGERTKLIEIEKLIHFVSTTDMLKSFEDEYFTEYAERIVVLSRSELRIELKCGLKLTERMVE